jgi:hypothetical protein
VDDLTYRNDDVGSRSVFPASFTQQEIFVYDLLTTIIVYVKIPT